MNLFHMLYSLHAFGCIIPFLLSRPNLVLSSSMYINNLRNSLASLTFQEKRGTLIDMQNMY